jgi:hypothetical protein
MHPAGARDQQGNRQLLKPSSSLLPYSFQLQKVLQHVSCLLTLAPQVGGGGGWADGGGGSADVKSAHLMSYGEELACATTLEQDHHPESWLHQLWAMFKQVLA